MITDVTESIFLEIQYYIHIYIIKNYYDVLNNNLNIYNDSAAVY